MQPKLSTLERLRELAKINTRIFASKPRLGNTYVEEPDKFHLARLREKFRDNTTIGDDKHGWNNTQGD